MKMLLNILGFALSVFSITQAQVTMRQAGEVDGVFHLPELQVILSSANNTVRVDMVLPKHMRGDDYKDLEIGESDQILMINARRVKHIDELKKMYGETKIGGSFKMGLMRKGELRLLDFKKADPESLPKARIKLMTGNEDDAMSHIYPLMGTGIILNQLDGKIVVEDKLERGVLWEKDIEKGDVITQVNGKPVKTTEQVQEIYDGLKTDTKVEVAYVRKGESKQLSFQKPKTQGAMMIRE